MHNAADPSVTASREIGCDSSLSQRELTGAQAVYSDLDCYALSVTGGSFSTNPGRHVMRGYAAGRRNAESPYLVGEVTAFQEENRAVIQPLKGAPFNLSLVIDELSASFAPGSVSLVKLAKEVSELGDIVGETTELIAYVDLDGPEPGEWDVSYSISPLWRKSHDVGRTLVNCFTNETEISVRLNMSLLSVQEGDLVLASGPIEGEEDKTKSQIFTVQYDEDLHYPYIDFICTASLEWVSDWAFRKVRYDDDRVAGVIHPDGSYVEYDNLFDAFEDAQPQKGAVVVMLKDWDGECNIPVPTGSEVTLDLNGKVIDSSWNGYYSLRVEAGSDLTVVDSSPGAEGKIIGGRAALGVGIDTPLTIKGGTFVGNEAGVITMGPSIDILGGVIHGVSCKTINDTRVVLNGGRVESSGRTIDNAGSVEVYDGGVYATGERAVAIAAGDLTVAGGEVTVDGKEASAIACDGRITITGGEISATGELSRALNCGDTATVNGGSISADGDGSSAIYSLLSVTVSGGDISANGDGSAALYNDGTSPFTVTGGRFMGALRADEQSTDYIEVSGGVFSQDPTPWLKTGWEARQNPDDQLWYVEEHVDISAVWEDDYSAATLTVTHSTGETETLDAAVTLSENEDHSFNITATGTDASSRSYSVTLESVASFRVSVGDIYSAYFPVAQDKAYAAFTVTEDMLTGLTPPPGSTLDGLEKDGTIYHTGDTVRITADTVFSALWRSTWARVSEALAAGLEITLLNDIAPDKGDDYLYVPAATEPSLYLGGHTINRTLTGAIADGFVLRVDGSLTLSGGTITGGNNSGNGGGLFVNSAGSVEASDMAFTYNNAANGGGVYVADGGDYSQVGGSITENRAVSYGGGLYIGGYGLNSVGGAGLLGSPNSKVVVVQNVQITHNFSGLDGCENVLIYGAAGSAAELFVQAAKAAHPDAGFAFVDLDRVMAVHPILTDSLPVVLPFVPAA